MLVVELTLAALTLGGLYALIAMGLTLQYGVARIMNLSHGEFMIGAAFFAFTLITQQGVNPLLALALAMPLGFVIQWLVYQLLMTPLVRRAASPSALEVDSILATFGLLFIVLGVISEYLAMVFTETRNRPLYVVRLEIGRGSTGRASR